MTSMIPNSRHDDAFERAALGGTDCSVDIALLNNFAIEMYSLL